MPQSQGTRFTADPLTFIVKHQLWDANVEDHSDQGISIEVAADVDGRQTTLLLFNCFDIERSYVYGPENPELTTAGRIGGGMGVHCRMDPITDGNPIGWTIRTLGQKLPKMLERAGYKEIARATDLSAIRDVLPAIENDIVTEVRVKSDATVVVHGLRLSQRPASVPLSPAAGE